MKHLPPLAAGVYVPTPAFVSIAAHAAVMFERNSGLVATTGRAEDPEAQRYARLFAAAPVMLDALEALMEFWDNGTPVHPGADVVQDACTAIAKARGENE